MAELKTKENDADVNAYLDAVTDEKRREDSYKALALMTELSGSEAKMWGGSIVGFGNQI